MLHLLFRVNKTGNVHDYGWLMCWKVTTSLYVNLNFFPAQLVGSSTQQAPHLQLYFGFFCVLVRPLVLIKLRVVVWLAVLHCNTPWQDGGHVVANRLSLCLLFPLLLHLPQLDTWTSGRGKRSINVIWLKVPWAWEKTVKLHPHRPRQRMFNEKSM